MVQLVLLLLGTQAVQRHWLRLAALGLVWTALGLVVITDPRTASRISPWTRSAPCW